MIPKNILLVTYSYSLNTYILVCIFSSISILKAFWKFVNKALNCFWRQTFYSCGVILPYVQEAQSEIYARQKILFIRGNIWYGTLIEPNKVSVLVIHLEHMLKLH